MAESRSRPETDPSLLRMAAPLVVSFVMRAGFTLVDTIYASTLGDAAVAAIGLAIPFEFLMIALWVGLSTGMTSTVSRAMGARQEEKVRQYVAMTWRLVFGLSPAFGVLGAGIWFFAGRMALEPDVAEAFRIYGTVLIGGSAATGFWSIIPDSLVKAHQDTRTTMWAGIYSNVLNVVLNTVFLFVFEWGIFGIAFSTVVGRLAGLTYASLKASRHEQRRRAEWAKLGIQPGSDARPLRSILSLAVPAALSFALMSGETAIVNRILADLEHATEAIAAYSIYYRVAVFALNPIIAVGVAMLPYAARRVGQEDYAGVRRGLREAGLAVVAYVALVVLPASALGAQPVASFLGESPQTVGYAAFALYLVPVACLVGAPFMLLRPVFEGLGRGRPGLVMAIVRYLLLGGPAAFIGGRLAEQSGWPGVVGVVIGLLVAAGIASSVFWVWLRAVLRERDPA